MRQTKRESVCVVLSLSLLLSGAGTPKAVKMVKVVRPPRWSPGVVIAVSNAFLIIRGTASPLVE